MTIVELRQALGAAVDRLNTDAVIRDAAAYAQTETEIAEIRGQIERMERAQAAQAALARPVPGASGDGARGAEEVNPSERTMSQIRGMDPRPGKLRGFDDYLSLSRRGLEFTPDRSRHFRSIGEQLQAIFRHYSSKGSDSDPRLVRAPTGASEVDPTGGGFLVQVDFATSIFMLAHDMGEILGRVNKLPISERSNGLKIPGVDETSRATGSRWGGVQSFWAAEGSTVTATKPKFRTVEFDLKKMMSVMYTTDELLQDSTALGMIAAQAFSEEVMFMTEDAIFEGTGAGQPLGIKNSPAKVSVAKEAGQAAGTIVKANIDKMWSRCWGRARKDACWFINQEAEPQLFSLVQEVGTGGAPVYLPPGGYSAAPYATLMGRPVIVTEYNDALGTEGDIVLADFGQYTIVDKNGVQAATSMHVAFLSDEMVFRITYRVDGKPMWHAPLAPFKGTQTKSPFITLGAR